MSGQDLEWAYSHQSNEYTLDLPLEVINALKNVFPGSYLFGRLTFERLGLTFEPDQPPHTVYILDAEVGHVEPHGASATFDAATGQVSYNGELDLLQAVVPSARRAPGLTRPMKGGLDVLLSAIENGEIRRE